jgi:hypothetical protein
LRPASFLEVFGFLSKQFSIPMAHIVLLGDSIFDNGRYTDGGPDVISQVRQLQPLSWQATLLAVDGATTEQVPAQLVRMPISASHLVLSVGGNNALENMALLHMPATSASDVLLELALISRTFEEEYRSVIKACRQVGLPLAVCTIYNGNFVDEDLKRKVSVALMAFNDVILRTGIEFGLAMIDLRSVCSAAADYANPIEPSSVGGAKIARAIVNSTVSERAPNTGARLFIA